MDSKLKVTVEAEGPAARQVLAALATLPPSCPPAPAVSVEIWVGPVKPQQS